MSVRIIISITLLISAIAFPAQGGNNKTSIYRWIDDNNIVHFSQYQPRNDHYSQLTTIASYKTQEKKTTLVNNSELKSQGEIAKQKKSMQEEAKQKKILAKNKEIFAKNCSAAQLNIKMLNSLNKILDTDPESGETKILSEKDKKERLKMSKKQIALYCDKK